MSKNKGSLLILFILLLVAVSISVISCTNGNTEATTEETTHATESATTDITTVEETSDTEEVCDHAACEWRIDTPATCKNAGSKTQICLNCGDELGSEEIALLPHTEEVVPGTAATCKTEGITDGKKCSECGTELVAQVSIPMLNHTETVIEGIDPTCNESGLTDGKKCSVCGDILVEQTTVEKLNHSEGGWIVDVAAQVGVEGSKHTECVLCGEKMNTEMIPAIKEDHVHQGKEWVTTTPSTCSSKGVSSFVCECGETLETKEIDYAEHTERTVLGMAPSCTATGLTDGKKCSVCGKVTVKQQPIAKVDHTLTTILGKDATCTATGTTDGKKCSVCGLFTVTQQIIPPKGHNFVNGICSNCSISEPYGIWIVDGLGNPISNVVVKVMKDGERVGLYPYNGEFLVLDLEPGSYTLELDLSALGDGYVFDENECNISQNDKTAFIKLYKTVQNPEIIYVSAPIDTDYDAGHVGGTGSYLVELTPNDYTFIIFAPSHAALYTISYECDSELTIGYHGSSFFTQGYDMTEVSSDFKRNENGSISFNVFESNVGGDYVFSIKSNGATSCVISISESGDTLSRLEDEPWVPYLENEAVVNAQLNADKTGEYTVVDITDMSLVAVYNDHDGYYHIGSADGPIIFIDLTTTSQFVSSIQTICANQRMGTYVYDMNGNVVEKRSYNELFFQYGMPSDAETVVDEPIRVPLTAKLAEAIVEFGNKNSWWTGNSETNIFTNVLLGQPYNTDIAWLLFCGYYQ